MRETHGTRAPPALPPASEPEGAGSTGPAAASPPSFEQVYDEHFPFVWRTARRLGVSDANVDDVVQDVFLIVLRKLPTFEGRSSLKTWLFGIAVGVARNHRRTVRRKAGARVATDVGDLGDADAIDRAREPGPHACAVRAEAVRLLYRILDDLDDDKRETFVMAELEHMTAAEIADVLAVNVNTVYSRLRAARRAFEDAVARHRARDGWRLR